MKPEPSTLVEQRLKYVRLGKVQRSLLLVAPEPMLSRGLIIDDPAKTRSAQNTTLRAAHRLRAAGLIDIERIPVTTRARDPRRERPMYLAGDFWRRRDPTRSHVVFRRAIWLTPLGAAVRRCLRRELESGMPIRWTPKNLWAVGLIENRIQREDRRTREGSINNTAEIESVPPQPERFAEDFVQCTPSWVKDSEGLERWQLAVMLARASYPRVGSGVLWDRANELAHGSLEELRRAAERRSGAKPGFQPRFALKSALDRRMVRP